MNHLFLLTLLLTFISCSKNGDSNKEEIPLIQEASVSAIIGQEEPILIDLGNVISGKTLDGTVILKQSDFATLVPSGLVSGKLVLDAISSPQLSIMSQSGCTSIKRTTGSCTLKIRANAKDLGAGSSLYGEILVHQEGDAESRIIVTSTVVPSTEQQPTSIVSVAPVSLNFGALSITDKPKDMTLTFKALVNIDAGDQNEVAIPLPFVLQSPSADRCSNKHLAKNETCSVKIRLDPKSLPNGNINSAISFIDQSVLLSAIISGNPEIGAPEVSQLVWIYNNQEISALDLGTLLSSNVPVKFNLYLKNKGSSNEAVNVSIAGSGFNIINRCQNKTLLPNAQCSLEVRPESSAGSKSVSISVDGQPSLSLPLSLVVTTTVEPVVTYATVDKTASCESLNLQVCGGTQNISKSYICEQYIDGVKNESYSGNDCQPLADMSDVVCQSDPGQITVAISNGTQQVNCLQGSSVQTPVPDSIVCDLDYHLSSGACELNEIACPVSNGSGTQIWNGSAYGQCQNITCSSGFVLSGQSCIASVVGWSKVATGNTKACGIYSVDNKAYCWGYGIYDSLGNGINDIIPQKVNDQELGEVIDIAVGNNVICAIRKVDKKLFCWGGWNEIGSIGVGQSQIPMGYYVPQEVIATEMGAVQKVEIGMDHVCSINLNDELYCWGWNDYGQVSSNGGNVFIPTKISSIGTVSDISLGNSHSCAIKKTNNKGYCWGRVDQGSLGGGLDIYNSFEWGVPSPILDTNLDEISKIIVKADSSCAVRKSDEKVFCWGSNYARQVSFLNDDIVWEPTDISSSSSLSQYAPFEFYLGAYSSCVVSKTNNKGYCWGWNFVGNLGNGNYVDQLLPSLIVDTELNQIQDLSLGYNYACARSFGDNKAYCWGQFSNSGSNYPETYQPIESPFPVD